MTEWGRYGLADKKIIKFSRKRNKKLAKKIYRIVRIPLAVLAVVFAVFLSARMLGEMAVSNISDAFRQYGLKTVEAANARIETIIAQSCRMAERAECDAEVRAIILSMLTRTHTVSYTARAAAAVCGVKTVCEYVAVEIGGYTVMVDPIRVVSV